MAWFIPLIQMVVSASQKQQEQAKAAKAAQSARGSAKAGEVTQQLFEKLQWGQSGKGAQNLAAFNVISPEVQQQIMQMAEQRGIKEAPLGWDTGELNKAELGLLARLKAQEKVEPQPKQAGAPDVKTPAPNPVSQTIMQAPVEDKPYIAQTFAQGMPKLAQKRFGNPQTKLDEQMQQAVDRRQSLRALDLKAGIPGQGFEVMFDPYLQQNEKKIVDTQIADDLLFQNLLQRHLDEQKQKYGFAEDADVI